MTYSNKYVVALIVEGDMVGDGMFVAREVWQTLEEYLELVKRNSAGCHTHEIYEGPTGTKLSVIASIRNATQIPYEGPRLRDLMRDRVGPQVEEK